MKNSISQLFYIKKTKIDTNQKTNIYLRITVNGKRAEFSIQRKISIEKWNTIIKAGASPVWVNKENYQFYPNIQLQKKLTDTNYLVKTGWTSGDHNAIQTDPITLTANTWYPIYIQHVQLTSTERLRLQWQSTSQVSETIPASAYAYDNKEVQLSLRNEYLF